MSESEPLIRGKLLGMLVSNHWPLSRAFAMTDLELESTQGVGPTRIAELRELQARVGSWSEWDQRALLQRSILASPDVRRSHSYHGDWLNDSPAPEVNFHVRVDVVNAEPVAEALHVAALMLHTHKQGITDMPGLWHDLERALAALGIRIDGETLDLLKSAVE